MTRIYCGWCGSACDVSARFCRSCGGEMAAQSGPLAANPPAGRRRGRSESGSLSAGSGSLSGQSGPSTHSAPPLDPEQEIEQKLVIEEKQAVQTLKRLRTSGPLILEEAMNNKDQMNDIIGQAVEGQLTDPPPAEVERTGLTPLTGPPSGWGERVNAKQISQAVRLDPPRRYEENVQILEAELSDDDEYPSHTSQGPAQVLADASGLESGSSFGIWLRLGMTVVVLLLSTIGYLIYRERLTGNRVIGNDGRELRSVSELSDEAIAEGDKAAGLANFQDALVSYTQARRLTPNNPKVLVGLSRTYAQLGRLDDALQTYNDLVRIAPENLDVRLEIARIHQQRKDWTSALREYKMIIALDQNSLQSAQALEEIENYEAQRIGAKIPVRPSRNRQAKSLPKLPSPRLAQGEVSLQPPQIPISEIMPPDLLNGGKVEEKPDPAALVASRRELGMRYLNIREYRAAIKEFLIVLRLTPDDKDIYYFLASAYHGLEMYPEAYEYYKRVDRGRYVEVAQSGAKRTQKQVADQQRRTSP